MPVMRMMLRKYPAVARAMAERHIVYNAQMEDIDRQEREDRIFVIRPPQALGIHRTEKRPEELEKVYQTGRQEALMGLKELKAYLEL